jgi:enamine deaminase RidA (YjgF/YER057c/UK114 family)
VPLPIEAKVIAIIRVNEAMGAEARLKELGIELPEAPDYLGNYIGAKWVNNIAFSCGQGPFNTTTRAPVGAGISIDEAYIGAREVGLNCLAQLRKQLGSLDRIKQVLQVVGFVNGVPGFQDQPKVLNGMTDLLVEVFGDPEGKPARAAIPCYNPGWICVEAWLVVELHPEE